MPAKHNLIGHRSPGKLKWQNQTTRRRAQNHATRRPRGFLSRPSSLPTHSQVSAIVPAMHPTSGTSPWQGMHHVRAAGRPVTASCEAVRSRGARAVGVEPMARRGVAVARRRRRPFEEAGQVSAPPWASPLLLVWCSIGAGDRAVVV